MPSTMQRNFEALYTGPIPVSQRGSSTHPDPFETGSACVLSAGMPPGRFPVPASQHRSTPFRNDMRKPAVVNSSACDLILSV